MIDEEKRTLDMSNSLVGIPKDKVGAVERPSKDQHTR